eukprot:TRINITY_DN4016_c1_g1_i1.p5 TRINITY_DN4016_c1_g1~~TRINITY_DN4016_c1_g1_i1.p5  ORF type:complete len:145 (-),score=27.36 TRINITY_DN4016_c1_g1_i1:119-553(-)
MESGQPKKPRQSQQHSQGGGSTSEKPLTHEQLIASKTTQEEILSIDGWVPPFVTQNVVAESQQPETQSNENNSNNNYNSASNSYKVDGEDEKGGNDQLVDEQNNVTNSLQKGVQADQQQSTQEEPEDLTSDEESSLSQEGLKYF